MRPPTGGARLLLLGIGGVLTPGAGAQPLPFTEEAISRGVNFGIPAGPQAGRGIALVDLNGDGFLDLVLPGGMSNAVGLYQNDGMGHFISRSTGSGIAAFTNASGITAADYDGDGDLDLYLSRWNLANVMLRNDGDFHFTNVSSAARVNNNGATMGCTWGDYNADGHLDLYVSNFTNIVVSIPNALYRNNGNGVFADVAPALGITNGGYTWQSAFFDADGDTRPDLYVSNDKGYELPACSRHNAFYHNIVGGFEDLTFSSGTAACVESMGLAIGDFDNNRCPDIYITNTLPGNQLFMNQGDLTFVEVGETMGVRSYDVGWGAAFFDYDGDGWLDLYVCNTDVPSRLYVRSGSTTVDMAAPLGVDLPALAKQVVAAGDIDNDGDVDLVVQSVDTVQGLPAPVCIFINHEGERRSWARFRVVGAPRNRFGYGVTAEVRTGELWQWREVLGCGGFKCQDDPTLIFGLADAQEIDEIVVKWPGGSGGVSGDAGGLGPVTRTLRHYPANHTWTLYPDYMLGGADPVTGALTTSDFFDFLNCFFVADGALTPGCEIMDMDSDGRFTSNDFFEFLDRLFN